MIFIKKSRGEFIRQSSSVSNEFEATKIKN